MKLRYLVLASVAAFGLGVLFLLLNHRYAVTTARAIIVKDNNGQDVTADVNALTTYVHSHMRTGVNFELAASYDRAVEAAKAAAQPNVNSGVYAQAQAVCKQKVATVQTKCIADYVASHAAPAQAGQVNLPERSSFTYTLEAPGWTPDAPGILFLVSLCGFVLAIWFRVMGRPRTTHF